MTPDAWPVQRLDSPSRGVRTAQTPRPHDLAVLIVTRNRPSDLRRCLRGVAAQSDVPEVVILDNASDPPVTLEDSLGRLGPCVIRSSTTLGVAEARNLVAAQTAAPHLVFLDDDAVFEGVDTVARISWLLSQEGVDLLALNCVDLSCEDDHVRFGKEQMHLIRGLRPGIKEREIGLERCVPCAAFVGAGFAVRHSVFNDLQGFRADFRYGGEEYHFGLRALDAGFHLLYTPYIRVRHYHSTTWRLSEVEREAFHLRNRWVTAAELLPWPWVPVAVVASTAGMWWRLRMFNPLGSLRGAFMAFVDAWRHRRAPISSATMREVLRLRGRL